MLRSVVAIASPLALSACLSSNVLMTVRPDGSGTIEQTTTIRPAAMAEASRILPDLGPVPNLRVRDPRTPEGQNEGWQAMGAVRVVSDEALTSPGTRGRRTVYEFDDVRGLNVGLLPALPRGVIPVPAGTRTAMRFTVTPRPDGTHSLKIELPRFPLDEAMEPPALWASGPADEMARLRGVLEGSRMTFAVRTDPPIVRTNSPHLEEDRVVLLDVVAGQALFSRNIEALRVTPATFDELLAMIVDLPGVTVARDLDITIDFGVPQPAAQPSNDPDIFLATLASRDGRLVVGAPVNITHSPGYDNQPSFTKDGGAVLFSSVRGASQAPAAAPPAGGRAAAPPTDIWRYDISSDSLSRVTNTPEAEYSPTVMPDGLHISVVRVEADGTQRLWKFDLDGRNPALVLTDIKPVGYRAWIDANTLALFVLGQPATLQIADVRTGKALVAAQGIGRSVLRTPSGAVSFVRQQRTAPDIPPVYTIEEISPATMPPTAAALVQPVPGSGDPNLAWMPDGTLLTTHEGALYSWRRGDRDWTRAADLTALGLNGVTRIAVSPKGDRIAIVAVPR